MKKPEEPFFWGLFSAGGVVSAMLVPVHLIFFGLAIPMLWVEPSYTHLHALMQNPIVKAYLMVLCSLPLFHWAHRFRFTLYDGLQIKHLNELIFAMCYGGAVIGTGIAGWAIWRL